MSDQFINLHEFEQAAKLKLEKSVFEFYAGGADDEISMKENSLAFSQIRLKAKALADSTAFRGLGTEILGHKVGSPVGIAPTAFHQLACEEGEIATVKAAEKENVVVCISSMSNIPIEELSAASPSSLKILQLYLSRLEDFNSDILS